jgi:outer membrane protein assembly factor BamB
MPSLKASTSMPSPRPGSSLDLGWLSFALTAQVFIFATSAHAEDWPNWRGPDLNGISKEKGWQTSWPDEGPGHLWKFSVGIGFSGLSVSQGRLYTIGGASNDYDTVYCLDAGSGTPLWIYSYPSPLDPNSYEGGPSSTPTVDGGRVYTLSKRGDLLCLDAAKGALIWSKNVPEETGAIIPQWGFASSPLIEGDLLILNAGLAGTAYDKRTGRLVWHSAMNMAGYATPVPFNLGTNRFVAIMAAQTLEAVRVNDGKRIWSFPWKTEYDVNATAPVIDGGLFFISSAYSHGAALLRSVGGQLPTVVWSNKELMTHLCTSVLWQDYLYGVSDDPGGDYTKTELRCLEFKTGRVRWKFPLSGKGSFVLADGKLIVLSGAGELMTAEASPTQFKVISRAQVIGGKCWTVPTLANGKIYCRNARGDLVCLNVKGN